VKTARSLFSVRVSVPATTANLGPGFDALGLALNLCNEVELRGWKPAGAPTLSMTVAGEGAGKLPLDRSNLVFRAVQRTFSRAGVKMPSVTLRLRNRIPLARGLGSSSAAIVGGIVAANRALRNPLTEQMVLDLAAEMEGHPDNVTPALLGGLCASVMSGMRVRAVSWKAAALFNGLRAVLCVPEFELSTARARSVLPARVSRADAVFNISRVALLLSALQSRRFDLLSEAMHDRLHQPCRAKLVPGLMKALQGAGKAGAYGAALSGAGPSVLALCPPSKTGSVGKAMVRVFGRHRVAAKALVLAVSPSGARWEKG